MIDQLFKDGEHRHIHGDSTRPENYELLFDDGKKASMLYADPPFCLLTRRRKKGDLRDPKRSKVAHDSVTRFENVREFKAFTRSWMEPAAAKVKDDGILCIWINFLGKDPIKAIAKDIGFDHFLGEFQWAKLTKGGSGNEVMARIYEVALVFSRKAPKTLSNSDLPVCWSVVGKYDEDGEALKWGNHPNHKPFTALEPLLRTYSQPGDIILDPFSGSGSTPAASLKLGRNIRAIELREEWAAMTRKRISATIKEVE
jgi:site-specific DNA-methyltransferase (adenine-specific)